MSVSRDQILNLLEQTLEGHGLIGGRRKVRRSRSMPHRRRSMRGRGDEEMVIEFDDMPMMNRYSSVGNGLIGGRKKSRTKSKSKKMSAATKAYLAEYHRTHPRRKRGRGLIGGDNQQYFNDLIDEYLYNQPKATLKQAKEHASRVIAAEKEELKLGIRPMGTKDELIRAIKSLEKRLGIPESMTTHLREIPKIRLEKMLSTLQEQQLNLRAPTRREREIAEEEDRYFTTGRAERDADIIASERALYAQERRGIPDKPPSASASNIPSSSGDIPPSGKSEESKEAGKAEEGKTYLQLQKEAQDKEDARAQANLQNAVEQLDEDPFVITARQSIRFEPPENTDLSRLKTRDLNTISETIEQLDKEFDTRDITDSNISLFFRDPFVSGMKSNILDVKRILNLLFSDYTFVSADNNEKYKILRKALSENRIKFGELASDLRFEDPQLRGMFDTYYTKVIRRFYQLLMSNKNFSTNLTDYKYSESIINSLLVFRITDPESEEENITSVDVGEFS